MHIGLRPIIGTEIRALCALPLAIFALSGCTVPSFLCVTPNAISTLTLESTRDTNQRTALAVDLLFVHSDGLAGEIANLEARDYFAGREQLLLDHPGKVESRLWELAPGQSVQNADLKPPCGVEAVFLFADFRSDGAHRLRLDNRSQATVILGVDSLSFSE